jgi:GNAT superfamily N-acetyltransferase
MASSDCDHVILRWEGATTSIDQLEPDEFAYETIGDVVSFDVVDGDEVEVLLGRFRLYYLDFDAALNAGVSAFDVIDSYSATADYYVAFFDDDASGFNERLLTLLNDDVLESNVLVIDRLELLPQYRGKRLGLRAMSALIRRFGAGAGVVAIKPFPLQFEAKTSVGEDSAWRAQLQLEKLSRSEKKSINALRRHYAQLGFAALRGTPFMFRSATTPLPNWNDHSQEH